MEAVLALCIVVVLVGLVVITAGEMRERRRSGICASRLRLLNQGFRMYAAEWNGAFPRNAPQSKRYFAQESPWPAQIASYVRDRRAFRCPDDPSRTPSTLDAPRGAGHVTSYPMNSAIGSFRPNLAETAKALTYGDIETPAQTMLLADRDPWHFARSGKTTHRLGLFVDGRVVICWEEMYERYWGQLSPE